MSFMAITVQLALNQSISLSMEIEWKEKDVYFESKCDRYNVPFLKIEYVNNSKQPYFFL